TRVSQWQCHVGETQQLAVRRPRESQPIRWGQDVIAELRDAEAVVRQWRGAPEETPARRCDLAGVAIRRAVHAELRRTVMEPVAHPVSKATLHGLENVLPGGTP